MIEQVSKENIAFYAQMAHQLWPEGELEEHLQELLELLHSDSQACFLYKTPTGKYIGFIQLSLRSDYVEGCETSPVAYVEGIFVAEPYRKTGIAREMIAAGEKWGKEKGCQEIASDAIISNELSIQFHKAVGFTEANRIVCFAKQIL